jgi:mannose-1-phosphate guanylyltransferase
MTRVSAVMVLAAGRGERMRPLSEAFPKPALPLVGGPVVRSALNLAERMGSDRIVVNTWHLGDRMAAAVDEAGGSRLGVVLSPEPALMGTAGGLALARDRGFLGTGGPVLVINGDGYHDLDLTRLLERHTLHRDAVTLALLPHPDPTRWSRVLIDPEERVIAIRRAGEVERNEECRHYPGVMVVSRKSLDALPSAPGEIPDRLWFPALETGQLGSATISGSWREVGTPADYLSVIMEQLSGGNCIHPTAEVARTAEIESSFIGRDARIRDRARVRHSVVVEGATVEADASVDRSVLLGSIRAGSAAAIDRDVRVGPLGTE